MRLYNNFACHIIQVHHLPFFVAAGEDFIDFDRPMRLEFNENVGIHSFTVDIIDDTNPELTERFYSILQTSESAVRLDPQRATITILDDDGKLFLSILYSMSIIIQDDPS